MKVSLRAPVGSDFQVMESLRNDPLVQRELMIEQSHYSPPQVRAWIRKRTNDSHGIFFVIDSDGPCGFAQLTRINRKQGTADFGICLVRSAKLNWLVAVTSILLLFSKVTMPISNVMPMNAAIIIIELTP